MEQVPIRVPLHLPILAVDHVVSPTVACSGDTHARIAGGGGFFDCGGQDRVVVKKRHPLAAFARRRGGRPPNRQWPRTWDDPRPVTHRLMTAKVPFLEHGVSSDTMLR